MAIGRAAANIDQRHSEVLSADTGLAGDRLKAVNRFEPRAVNALDHCQERGRARDYVRLDLQPRADMPAGRQPHLPIDRKPANGVNDLTLGGSTIWASSPADIRY